MVDVAEKAVHGVRRGEVDVMRAALVFGLILFHSARIYDLLPFYVKNEDRSLLLMILVGFVSQWGMPLFFLIAGIAAWHSLSHRTAGQFVVDRVRRLIVPLIFGLIVLVPPQHYFSLRTNPDYHDSFWDFYPKFFRVVLRVDFPEFVRPDPAVGIFGPAHLWFLEYLFAYSVVLLPLLVYLRGEQGKRLIGSLAEYCEKGSRVLLLSLPVITIETFVLTEESTGWNRFAYIPFLLSGYVFGSEPRFEKTLCKVRYAGLIGGSLSVMAFFAVSVVTYQGGIDPTHGWALKSVLWRFLKAISSFLWMVAILGFVNRYRSTRRLRVDAKVNVSEGELPDFIRGGRGAPSYDEARTYANEAVMPFYILHQTLVVVLGYYIVKLNAGIGIKYAMTVIGTFLITLLLYEFIVRRTRIARFLFGMKLAPNLGI